MAVKVTVGTLLFCCWVAFVLGMKFGEWGVTKEAQAKAYAAGVATRQFIDNLLGKG